jgi:tetratricopeptide (TPR) repeat protein
MKHWVWIGLLLPRLAHAAEPDAIQKRLDESIETLKPVIAHAAESEKPLLIFRLAELIWQKADHRKAKEMLAHDTAYVAWVEAGQKGEPPEVESFTRESRALRRNAVANYRRAAKDALERNDEIRFQLAYALYEIGEKKEAVEIYSEVARLFPNSRFAAQANLQLGEHWFDANELDPAQRAFERAYQKGDREVRDHALYKLAWCDFNRTDYAAGIEKLKRTERREAIEDLALFFAHAGDVDGAFSWYRTRAPHQLIRMVSILEEKGEWPPAIDARRRLLAAKIGDAISIRIGLMETLAKSGRSDELIAEAKLLDLRSPPGHQRSRRSTARAGGGATSGQGVSDRRGALPDPPLALRRAGDAVLLRRRVVRAEPIQSSRGELFAGRQRSRTSSDRNRARCGAGAGKDDGR